MMKVCTCCYDPMIEDANPFAAMTAALDFVGSVAVPEDTPRLSDWGEDQVHISHEVLEKAGLKWKKGQWCKPDGKHISGVYDITSPDGTFMEAWEQELYGDKSKIISFLKSRSKDTSTLGSGDHAKRQAKVLLGLFDQHVMAGFTEAQLEQNIPVEFRGRYPVLNFKMGLLDRNDEDENEGDADSLASRMGFDIKNLKALREALDTDQKKLKEMSIEPTSDSPVAKQYCHKLRCGLEDNLQVLKMATGATQDFYGLTDNMPSFGNPLGMLLGTFTARHNTDMTGAAVHALCNVMLPILLPKLKEAGCPDSEEPIRWDYGEPKKARGMVVASMLAEQLGCSISTGVAQKRTLSCKKCGHEVEVEVYQELETDGETPKGKPQIRGLPDACPNCGHKSND